MSILEVARAFGLMCMLPIGFSWLSFGLRTGLAFLFATFATGEVAAVTFPNVFAEFCLGLMLGFPLALTVSSGAMLGELLDIGRGQSLASIYDPLNQTVESVSAHLLKTLFLATCLMLGAGERLVIGYVESTKHMPIGEVFGMVTSQSGLNLLFSVCHMLALHFQLFIPLVALLLCIDLGVLWLGRIGINMNLNCEAFQLKTALGILFLYLLWSSSFSASLGTLMLPPQFGGIQ